MVEFQTNPFKRALREGRLQIGLWSSLCSNIAAATAEISIRYFCHTEGSRNSTSLPGGRRLSLIPQR